MNMDTFIPTRCAGQKDHVPEEFTCVQYQKSQKKSLKNINPNYDMLSSVNDTKRKTENKVTDVKKLQDLEMKRARYDVIKFGMSGFEKTKAKEAKVALMIKLGAKPPKNRRINYKRLQAITKEKNEEKSKEQVVSKNIFKDNAKKHYKKNSKGILGIYGNVKQDDIKRRKK